MSPNLIKAVISVEDQRFFEHGGVDAIRVAAAVVRNLEAGRRAEGGSTITQQLARQSFLTRDKTYRRKFKEIILASYIEGEFKKNEILEMYLNKVYFGDGLYGVEAAARGYLGKSAADLTVDEAALLAGLIQSPSAYAPSGNLDRAVARRAVVLQTMVSSGAIDRRHRGAGEAGAGQAGERARGQRELRACISRKQVRRELVERFGWPRVSQGGLRSTPRSTPSCSGPRKRWSRRACRRSRGGTGSRYPPRAKVARMKEGEAPDYLQGALVALDPATGYVRAMVGGRDFTESRFNRAIQAKRQSGSAFKPFVYAAAIEAGQSPASLITSLNDPILTLQGEWLPEDEHSDASVDDAADGAADVEQSGGGAVAEHGRHPRGGRLRREAQCRHAAERAVARAWRERGHAQRAHRRLRCVRQRRHRPARRC